MKEDNNDSLKTLHKMGNVAEECILLLQNAFIHNTSLPLKECRTKVEVIKKEEAQLPIKLPEIIRDNPDLKHYVSVPAHLVRIGENIEKLSELINKKISENILFSDKAVMEATFLLKRLSEVLRSTSDLILTRNKFLGMYIQESQASVGKLAAEYATLHEERLIKGICLTSASSLYINLLDAIKNIAWHTKEIATKITG